MYVCVAVRLIQLLHYTHSHRRRTLQKNRTHLWNEYSQFSSSHKIYIYIRKSLDSERWLLKHKHINRKYWSTKLNRISSRHQYGQIECLCARRRTSNLSVVCPSAPATRAYPANHNASAEAVTRIKPNWTCWTHDNCVELCYSATEIHIRHRCGTVEGNGVSNFVYYIFFSPFFSLSCCYGEILLLFCCCLHLQYTRFLGRVLCGKA